jgi:hypothetical protein
MNAIKARITKDNMISEPLFCVMFFCIDKYFPISHYLISYKLQKIIHIATSKALFATSRGVFASFERVFASFGGIVGTFWAMFGSY